MSSASDGVSTVCTEFLQSQKPKVEIDVCGQMPYGNVDYWKAEKWLCEEGREGVERVAYTLL